MHTTWWILLSHLQLREPILHNNRRGGGCILFAFPGLIPDAFGGLGGCTAENAFPTTTFAFAILTIAATTAAATLAFLNGAVRDLGKPGKKAKVETLLCRWAVCDGWLWGMGHGKGGGMGRGGEGWGGVGRGGKGQGQRGAE
jgi:hypothetical protein